MTDRRPSTTARTHLQILTVFLVILLGAGTALADNDTCFACHDDEEFEVERGGMTVSLDVDPETFAGSVHGEFDCTDCHEDASEDHPEDLARVECGNCHEDEQTDFERSIHGQVLARNAPFAPTCADCHGLHDILPAEDPESRIFKMNVPRTCGRCHREGAPVAETYDLAETNILENYSQSIHGEGLFSKGLTVTATCNDCHGSHTILPVTDRDASISPYHVAETCMKCHAQIERVHKQVIRGDLWEREPGAIPACTDCHRPHLARRERVALTVSDMSCLECHARNDVFRAAGADSVSMKVDTNELKRSAHTNIPCVKCHSDIDPVLDRPCEPAGAVDCGDCHSAVADEYAESGHGQARLKGVDNAPTCTSCHGDHGVLPPSDQDSPVFRTEIPKLCARCHGAEGIANEYAEVEEHDTASRYAQSVHGRALDEKGLVPSAVCTDCHTSHSILDHGDPRSSVYPRNLSVTCSRCHLGIYKEFTASVHYTTDVRDDEKVPSCAVCHSSHDIVEADADAFQREVSHTCGQCHEHLAETYEQTMHGKAYTLGYLDAAKCTDCHGKHKILDHNDPESTVSQINIVETCQQCHEDANARFTGYLTHATHHDPDRYPILFYTYWAMTGLLLSVFTLFGLHTLLWLPRSLKSAIQRRRQQSEHRPQRYVQRFTRQQRYTHFFVIISFLSLALTGMMLKFSGLAWTRFLADLLGGVRNAGLIHRAAAVITFGYFAWHIQSLLRHKREAGLSWKDLAFGPNSLMFNKRDGQDFVATVKWFVGRGPRPKYGRWTYWEKFDYLAVFWGVAVIGLTGLTLWFPEFFTNFVPGWFINVATIVHSDEALLAVGFIFTIHFFNTHLRPEAFPMDTVIFTGVAPLEHYREERAREVEELEASGRLEAMTVEDPHISPRKMLLIKVFGFAALFTGIALIVLILYSMLHGYK